MPFSRIKKWGLMALKIAIFLLVAWGIWREVDKAVVQFQREQFSLAALRWHWLAAAAAVYLAGMLPMGLFWYWVLRALGQRPRAGELLRAFYIGHLGKYVPGKAMVVILRTGLIRSGRVDTTVAAVSVFVETLTMMAVGAFLAALVIAVKFRDQGGFLVLALGLMAVAGTPTFPPLLRRIVHWLRLRKANPEIANVLRGLTLRVMAAGWAANLVGWCLLAVSLWAVLLAMPLSPEGAARLADPLDVLPLLIATVCLAMVAGFLSLIPGGLGVREFVIITLMAPVFSSTTAILSALLLRLVWLAAELTAAAVLYVACAAPRGNPAAADQPPCSESASP